MLLRDSLHYLMKESGLNARFFLLPGAPHGSYGRKGPQVMSDVFTFLFEQKDD